jgi:hypothetical protein
MKMTKVEQQIRSITVLELWNAETAARERLNADGMSEAEVLECIAYWCQAADLYKSRARQMRATAHYMRRKLRKLVLQRKRIAKKPTAKIIELRETPR